MIINVVSHTNSVIVIFCIISFVSCIVSARKDDKSKQQQVDPQYRFNYEVEEQDHDDNEQYNGSDSDNTWNMKGTYGFRRPTGEYR